MSIAILYRWRVRPGYEAQFRQAWVEGTALIHQRCGSFGARLHEGEDGLFWSYALWPDEECRQRCFRGSGVLDHPAFPRMQEAVAEHFKEVRLEPCDDLLQPLPATTRGNKP
ncbi:antibiotic biosynthesis monooxygenase domain protein [Thioalkalivibrio nitratireducens DSM 14787]|uniref:Antibiotic biosynthesis monooxygenase domain protein n=1 Tax=Thioalkalivibrio nitratireducens (strain DSM 14787 / UNIQEM 213 / ALEN2) TaxID=1255043 RepID=L0E009_THIND|nr:antibiotic biosynthesis monooxygenase [Thioalkalivibrio nitratireducens]AGA33951.1 antibiotic biosynthesis monooxygenase domain protein [Thioalkalivibrio nitratireducens DSM 14787]